MARRALARVVLQARRMAEEEALRPGAMVLHCSNYGAVAPTRADAGDGPRGGRPSARARGARGAAPTDRAAARARPRVRRVPHGPAPARRRGSRLLAAARARPPD